MRHYWSSNLRSEGELCATCKPKLTGRVPHLQPDKLNGKEGGMEVINECPQGLSGVCYNVEPDLAGPERTPWGRPAQSAPDMTCTSVGSRHFATLPVFRVGRAACWFYVRRTACLGIWPPTLHFLSHSHALSPYSCSFTHTPEESNSLPKPNLFQLLTLECLMTTTTCIVTDVLNCWGQTVEQTICMSSTDERGTGRLSNALDNFFFRNATNATVFLNKSIDKNPHWQRESAYYVYIFACAQKIALPVVLARTNQEPMPFLFQTRSRRVRI